MVVPEDPDAWRRRCAEKAARGINLELPLAVAVRLWPTAAANIFCQTPETFDDRRERLKAKHHNGNGAGKILAVEVKRWPTAMAGDAKSAGSRNLPGSAAHPGTSLTDAIRADRVKPERWPTASASTDNGGPHGLDGGARSRAMLEAAGVSTKINATLNPDWVEPFMGWPLGWTRPEPLENLVWPAAAGEWPAPHGPVQHDWEPPRETTDKRLRAKRLRALGNGWVPAAAALAFRLLSEDE